MTNLVDLGLGVMGERAARPAVIPTTIYNKYNKIQLSYLRVLRGMDVSSTDPRNRGKLKAHMHCPGEGGAFNGAIIYSQKLQTFELKQ